jgi:hypothetical protein
MNVFGHSETFEESKRLLRSGHSRTVKGPRREPRSSQQPRWMRSVLRTSVSHVGLAVVQTRGSEHFVKIWETTILYERPCSWIST